MNARIPLLTVLASAALLLAGCGGYTDPGGGGNTPPPSGSFNLSGPSEIEVPQGGETTFDVTVTFDAAFGDYVRLESGSWEAGLRVTHSEPGFPVSLRESPITGISGTRTFTLTLHADASADASADQNNFGTLIAREADEDGDVPRVAVSDQIKPRVVVR